MTDCLVGGAPNAGKTLFALAFAASLGCGNLEIGLVAPDGAESRRVWRLDEARSCLVGAGPHTTRGLQAIELRVPAGKVYRALRLVDTSGLADGIHADPEVRKAMAQTLRALVGAGIVLHLIDAARVGVGRPLAEVDRELANYGHLRRGYAILASKMDLPGAAEGFRRLRQGFPGHRIIPVSAVARRGLREVRAFVARHA